MLEQCVYHLLFYCRIKRRTLVIAERHSVLMADGDLTGFALAIFGFVAWTIALTQVLPRVLGRGLAFAVNRTLGKANLSISALYCYPLAGRFVVHDILYVDCDVAVTVGELVIEWRWWRRGRLTAFDDVIDESALSSASKDEDNNCGRFCSIRALLRSATSLQVEGPAALISISLTGLRVRVVNMHNNYELLRRLRNYVDGHFVPPEVSDHPDRTGKTNIDHLLEYSSLKVNSGALYCCDPGNTPLMLLSFSSAKVRYRHGRPRSVLDLFRYTLYVRVTELRVSVADLETLRSAGVSDPPEVQQSALNSNENEDMTCIPQVITLGNPLIPRRRKQSFFDCEKWFRRSLKRAKEELQSVDVIRASEASIEYVVDVPGPLEQAELGVEESEPPELRCSVELKGAAFVFLQKSISCLQDVQERLFPRLFDLTNGAQEFQNRLKQRTPTNFVLEITAHAEEPSSLEPDDSGTFSEARNKFPPALLTAPFTPRESTWRILDILNVNRSKVDDDDNVNEEEFDKKLPESAFSFISETISVTCEIPYKMGDPLLVYAELPKVQLIIQGIVSAPVCFADGLRVEYELKVPKVWNHLHKARLDCEILSGEITYMADLIRAIDDLGFQIDDQLRKPEDIRYFVPNEFTIGLKAVDGLAVRIAASRGNAWADIFKGITDEFGMAVLKSETAQLTIHLTGGLEYMPSVIPVHWRLDVPKPTLFLALPCPQPKFDPSVYSDYDEPHRTQSEANEEPRDHLTFAERVRILMEKSTNGDDEGTANVRHSRMSSKRSRVSNELLESEHVLLKIAEVGGSVSVDGRAKTHTELFADSVNENQVKVKISGIVFDLNPHHLQHFLNVTANLSAFVNHTLTAEEKRRIDLRRRALAYNIIEDGRVPTFDECVVLGTEGGISLATAAYNAGDRGPAATAMDEAVNVNVDIDGGVLILHNLPNANSAFTGHPWQVCCIDLGRVCFALTGNHKEVVSRFAPVPESAVFKVYAGQPQELRTNTFRKAQNRPVRESNLFRYPQVTISEFLLTRQALLNKQLGAYYSILDISIGKVAGCIQEVAVMAIIGFAKGAIVRPPYEEAPVVEALVGVQTIQVRLGRTDILVLCGSQALTIEESTRMNPESVPAASSRTKKVARRFVGFLPSQVTSIAQLRLRDGFRFCMSNVATNDFLSRTIATIPDLSVQLFTPWGGSSTRWIDESTLRAQVSHSSAIKAWRQVGVQQGRPVMHKAGVFENFVVRLVWESHPSLWSDTVHILQRSRLEGADKHTRNISQLWEASSVVKSPSAVESQSSVLESFSGKWWEYLDIVARRSRLSIGHEKATSLTSTRRDVVSVFILSQMTLSIGPEALELANYIATKIRSAAEEKEQSHPSTKVANCTPGDLIELWRDLSSLCARKEGSVRSRDEDRPSRVLGTAVHLNLHVKGARVHLICPFLAEDTMDRSRSQPIVIRDERVCASFPNGLRMSYRWRSQRGAKGIPAPIVESSSNPTSPAYSFSLRQSAFLRIPAILIETSKKTVATVEDIEGRLSDSISYRRKRRIGLDVAEETHRGNHRTFDFSVSSINFGLPASDLETLSEVGRVFSIYGLMLRAVGLDLDATYRWYQERREYTCEAVFAIPFSVLCELPVEDIELICFGRQTRFLKSQRFVPRFEGSELVEKSFLAGDELENKLASIGSNSVRFTDSRQDSDLGSVVSRSISVTAGIKEIKAAVCEREAISIRNFEGEGQLEIVQDARFGVQEPPVARIGIGSAKFSLRDDVAELGMRSVSSVASYIRFAAAYIPMLSYEVIGNGSEPNDRSKIPKPNSQLSRAVSGESATATMKTESSDDSNEISRRSRYTVKNSTKFMLRRNMQNSSQGNTKSPRTRRRKRSIEGSPRGLTPLHSPAGIGLISSVGSRNRSHTPRRPRSSSGAPFNSENLEVPPLERLESTPEPRPVPAQPINGSGLKDVLHIYKPPRAEEVSSAKIHGKKTGFVVRNVEGHSGLESKPQPPTHRPLRSILRTPKGRANGLGGSSKIQPSKTETSEQANIERSTSRHQSFSSSTAATIIFSISDVEVSYYRSEAQNFFGAGPSRGPLKADLCIAIDKVRASGVITPHSLCQSFVVTIDDASLRSGNNADCVLEGSVNSIVTMLSVASGVLPTDPKRVIASTKVSDFQLSLLAQDLRSVLAFREKFKKDLTSLAVSSLSARKSLAAMMRATKLENLTTRTSNRGASFATIAGDVSIEKVKASLLGFHPGDKDMRISYEVDSIFGSIAAMEDSSVTLSVGGLVYGHGLVLSSPSWVKRQRLGFPTLDVRGVQWMHTTGKPTQVNIITGPLNTSTSFQGLRNILFTVSGLLAFQNRTGIDIDNIEDSDSTINFLEQQRSEVRSASSMSDSVQAKSAQPSATLNRSLVAWQRTTAVKLEFSFRPMSIGLVSGDVKAAFDTESISGIIEWNKHVASGNQLQAVTQIPVVSLKYYRVDQTTRSPDERMHDNSSLLIATRDIRLDLLKSQEALTHNFVIRLRVGSIDGHLRPWRFMADTGVWANEQDVVQEFQAVNSDAVQLTRHLSRTNSVFGSDVDEKQEHRVITVGADVRSFSLAIPLLDEENMDNHRFRVTAADVRLNMRKFEISSRNSLAVLRSQFVGVLWEDSPFVSAQEFEGMFASSPASIGKKAHFGTIRGRCSTKTWIVCPRKDVVLAFIDAKGAPENRNAVHVSRQPSPPVISRRDSSLSMVSSAPDDKWQLFESVEFMVLPSRGYIRGLDSQEHFSDWTATYAEHGGESSGSSKKSGAELSIPTFSIAWLRNPKFDFDLFDVDFSGKNDEFPQGILRKTGNIFSELFGAIATSNSPEESTGDLPGFVNRPRKVKREISRDWSALFRFGKSRYVAREMLTGKLGARFEFYAGNHSGFLASVAASPVSNQRITENSTVVTGVAPLLSLKIKPDLEKAMTQGLELTCVRLLQGYAPSSAPHTCVHLQGVHASLDVMTTLLVREWLKRDRTANFVNRDESSEGSMQGNVRSGGPARDSNSLIVLGQPAAAARMRRDKSVKKSSEGAAVRIIFQLSQPDGRVGLLIQRIHCGFAVRKLRNSKGYSTDVHVGVHQIESRADWEYLACSFKLSRFLLRFEGERAMEQENICGFAAIMNLFTFDFKRGDFDALQLKVEGIAGACRVPDCDLAVQTTIVDASVSSSTGKTVQRLMQLATRLGREAKRQIDSMAITDSRLDDSTTYGEVGVGVGGVGEGRGAGGIDSFTLPRSRGSEFVNRHQQRIAGLRGAAATGGGTNTRTISITTPTSTNSTSTTTTHTNSRRVFSNATANISGDKLIINLHGYRFQDDNGAQFKFLTYEVGYSQQTGTSRSSDNIIIHRELTVEFELLDVCHVSGESSSHSVVSMPNPALNFTVQERGNAIIVDLFTKFDKEIIISSMVSHYDYLVTIFKMYGESRMQVKNLFHDNNELQIIPTVVHSSIPFGGRIVQFKRLVLSPRLQPLGELTPDILRILERFKLGKKEQIPAYLYDLVMIPLANALQSVTKPLL